MKALSIKQPWAGLIAQGLKTIETRTWQTKYRGDLLICASAKESFNIFNNTEFESEVKQLNKEFFINAHALCIVELYKIDLMTIEHEAAAMCEIYPSAYAWHLRNVRIITPFFVKGKLNIYDVEL